MDAMVSARVPAEVKKRGDAMLRDIGSTVTELVNSAYAYLLENGRLPKEEASAGPVQPCVKTLSGEQASEFKEQWASRSVLQARAYDGDNFKELLDEARGEYYARFA